MTGYIKNSWGWSVPTQPELWAQVKSEEEYFRILAERQKIIKPKPYDNFQIPDSEPGIVPGSNHL